MQIPGKPHYRDGCRRHAAGVARQHAAQQQHPCPLGTGHQRISHGGGQRREHDAQFAAQVVIEEHGAEPPRRRSQREHRLWGDTERGLSGSGLPLHTHWLCPPRPQQGQPRSLPQTRMLCAGPASVQGWGEPPGQG